MNNYLQGQDYMMTVSKENIFLLKAEKREKESLVGGCVHSEF